MTQYFTDFSEYADTAALLAEWTERWNTSQTVALSATEGQGGTKALEISRASTSTALIKHGLTWDSVDSDANRANAEVLMRFRVRDNLWQGSTRLAPVMRASGSSEAQFTAYLAGYIRPQATPSHRISRYIDNAFTDLVNESPFVFAIDTWYWVRARANGTTITSKVWADGDTEPVDWDLTDTDSGITGAGAVGLFFSTEDDNRIIFDRFGVGTNGDTAPSSAVGGGDTTAPTLSSPTGTQTGQTTASGSVSTDEANGTLDAVVTTSSTTPSAAQIQAGQDHTGSAAAATDLDNVVSATGVQNVSFTGLSAGTTYYVHYAHQDAAGNDSTAVSSASFTTDAATKTITVNLTDKADAALPNETGIAWYLYEDLSAAPTDEGTGETTDGSGELVITSSAATGAAATLVTVRSNGHVGIAVVTPV